MYEYFRNGGWPMFPTLAFGSILLIIAFRYAMKPDTRWIPLQIALGVLTLFTGAFGFVSGLIVTSVHLGGLPHDKVGLIGAIGFGESLCNMGLALALVVLASLAVCVGVARKLAAETKSPAFG